MIHRSRLLVGVLAIAGVAGSMAVSGPTSLQSTPATRSPGWTLPADAEDKKNPLPADAATLATGKAVFSDKCQRCHGPGGLGDGPDADPDAREGMDLTDPARAERNPEGVMFYKVWNGRRGPRMPAFSKELTEEQAWAVVRYAKSLRRAQ